MEVPYSYKLAELQDQTYRLRSRAIGDRNFFLLHFLNLHRRFRVKNAKKKKKKSNPVIEKKLGCTFDLITQPVTLYRVAFAIVSQTAAHAAVAL